MVTNRKRLFSNFFSLGIIQGTNYLLPILITPYVIKRIGADGFGIIAVTQVVMIVLVLLIVLILILTLVPAMRPFTGLYLLCFVTIIGQSLLMNWLFQGIERMKLVMYVTYINVIALRLFYSDTVVGYYSVAEKIISATRQALAVLLIALDEKRALFAVFISGTIINLIMNMCIVRIYGPVGTSFIILITECLVTAGLVGAIVINPKLGILKFLRSHARTS
jgi:O-antigen/teichoic acid export membrane protein